MLEARFEPAPFSSALLELEISSLMKWHSVPSYGGYSGQETDVLRPPTAEEAPWCFGGCAVPGNRQRCAVLCRILTCALDAIPVCRFETMKSVFDFGDMAANIAEFTRRNGRVSGLV
jgi:hypothetical protein